MGAEHPQFFPTVLKCPTIVGAKAPIALNTPLPIKTAIYSWTNSKRLLRDEPWSQTKMEFMRGKFFSVGMAINQVKKEVLTQKYTHKKRDKCVKWWNPEFTH